MPRELTAVKKFKNEENHADEQKKGDEDPVSNYAEFGPNCAVEDENCYPASEAGEEIDLVGVVKQIGDSGDLVGVRAVHLALGHWESFYEGEDGD